MRPCCTILALLGFCSMLSIMAPAPVRADAMMEGRPSSSISETPSSVGTSLHSGGGQSAPGRCARLPFRAATIVPHPAGIDDLLHLRDFGAGGLDMAAPPGFAVSPDGSRLAVQVRQAEPSSNTYCQVLLIFELARPAAPAVTIMMGADFARSRSTLYGMQGFPSGNARPLTPQWSPDGQWLAFVQRVSDQDELMVARATGGPVLPVARPDADIGAFSWASDGQSLEFEANAALHAAETRLREDGRGGYRYDDRFWMLAQTEPFPRGDFVANRFRVRLGADGQVGSLEPLPAEVPMNDRDRAWVEQDASPRFAYRNRVHAVVNGNAVPCDLSACESAGGAWWLPASRSVVFVRREGFASSLTGIYRWRPGGGAPRRLVVTQDALTGCIVASGALFCGRERSANPRDIVSIDLVSGAMRQVVDLNPEWCAVEPARITRLRWSNRFGIPAIGDLVLPSHIPTGKRLPLVVVQYETRGFLRGGTGDEYPIRVMAAQGFAVLSVSRPLDYNTWLARAGRTFAQKDLMENWSDRASVHDSLLTAVDIAVRTAPIDRGHMAITGLSDGASTAAYALIHARLFSLALLSTCCEDPDFTTTGIGPAYQAMLDAYEYPLPWQDHQASWRSISLALNPDRVCAQIQVQAADREARMALTTIVALRRSGVPIDMYVYPDEYHIKWQPAHRAAIYQRNLDTLREWRLRPSVSCVEARSEALLP